MYFPTHFQRIAKLIVSLGLLIKTIQTKQTMKWTNIYLLSFFTYTTNLCSFPSLFTAAGEKGKKAIPINRVFIMRGRVGGPHNDVFCTPHHTHTHRHAHRGWRNQLHPLLLVYMPNEHPHNRAPLALPPRVDLRLVFSPQKYPETATRRSFAARGEGDCFCSCRSVCAPLAASPPLTQTRPRANGRAGGAADSWRLADGTSGGSCPATAPWVYQSAPAIRECSE